MTEEKNEIRKKYRLYRVDNKGMIEYKMKEWRNGYGQSDEPDEFYSEEDALKQIPEYSHGWSIQVLYYR